MLVIQDVYEGEFQFGKRHGHGTFTYMNSTGQKGDSYEGEWKDDMRHGNGVFTYGASGKVLKGTWENNEWKGVFTVAV